MLNKIELSSFFIKKTAKNTLKHLKEDHPTLTLSELIEAMSKALGFNNYYSAQQETKLERVNEENIQQGSYPMVNELALYYPHKTLNVFECEAMNLGNIKEIVVRSTLQKENNIIYKKIETKNKLKEYLNELISLMPADPIEDFYPKLYNQYRQKILLKIKMMNKENILEELRSLIKELLINDFKTEYKEILNNEEKDSYANFNFQKETIETLLLNALYVLEMIIDGEIKKINHQINIKDCFLCFFRLVLNNNLFCASYKEKVLKLLLEEKDFILKHKNKKINIIYSFEERKINQKRLNIVNEKLNVFKQCLLSLYPTLDIDFKEQKERMYDSSMFFYDRQNKEVNIHLFDYYR